MRRKVSWTSGSTVVSSCSLFSLAWPVPRAAEETYGQQHNVYGLESAPETAPLPLGHVLAVLDAHRFKLTPQRVQGLLVCRLT
jgi:hypothetical protein